MATRGSLPAYRRAAFGKLLRRLSEHPSFIQILAGPRQAGKTTLARQVLSELDVASHYASADEPAGKDRAWLEVHWEQARVRAGETTAGAILVLDEVQKVPDWSNIVKLLWDQDAASGVNLRVVLLGSAPLLMERGLADSLAGRFELIRVGHWSFREMKDAFGWGLERYLCFGGYPGAASLVRDRARWAGYILDSIVETSVSRDILLMTRIDKPALLRQLFRLGCDYSGQVLSYTKMLGQLQDAGNTTTLAHYLDLLAGAGLIAGLSRFSGSRVRQRGSSPKLLVLNTALMTASSGFDQRSLRRDPDAWGRVVETAVGAHLVNSAEAGEEVFYWRDRNREVDFVFRQGRKVVGIEVKSGVKKGTLSGMGPFRKAYPEARFLLVGGQGIPLEEFLGRDIHRWIS